MYNREIMLQLNTYNKKTNSFLNLIFYFYFFSKVKNHFKPYLMTK